jgi:hypothetical protein
MVIPPLFGKYYHILSLLSKTSAPLTTATAIFMLIGAGGTTA